MFSCASDFVAATAEMAEDTMRADALNLLSSRDMDRDVFVTGQRRIQTTMFAFPKVAVW